MKALGLSLLFLAVFGCGGDKSSRSTAYQPAPGSLSDALCGAYVISGSSGAIYDTFIFTGAGRGTVSAMGLWGDFDFLQVSDTIYIYPDQSFFVMQVQQDGKLKGLDDWLEGNVYEKIAEDTTHCIASSSDASYLNKQYLFQRLSMKPRGSVTASDKASLEALCNDQFSKACLALASVGMDDALAKSIISTDKQKPDDEVLRYLQKSIDLGDVKGLAKMGEYYLLLYDPESAKPYYAKACDQGDQSACMRIIEEGW